MLRRGDEGGDSTGLKRDALLTVISELRNLIRLDIKVTLRVLLR